MTHGAARPVWTLGCHGCTDKEGKTIMHDAIDSRTMFTTASLTIELHRVPDEDASPDNYGPGSAYDDEETMAGWKSGEWEFNGLIAEVKWADVVIAEDSLWAVNHGTFRYTDDDGETKTVETDAFEFAVPDYGTADDGTPVVHMGSSANGVIAQAIDNAMTWARGAATTDSPLMQTLEAAQKWADPNAHKRINDTREG